MTNSDLDVYKILQLIQNEDENQIISLLKTALSNRIWTAISYKKTGDTILHYAARFGKSNVIKYLLNSNSTKFVDCKNKDDKTALHEAAQFSQFEICIMLIGYGADVNALKRGDWTPLMLACTKTNGDASFKTVEILLLEGAVVNFRNKDGWTCLHLISRCGNVNILQLLIKYNLDVKLKTKNGRSALHIAALHGHSEIISFLLKFDLNINEMDECGNTPLCEAVLGNHLHICRELIQHGADPGVVNKSNHGLIHLASYEGNINMIEYLLNDINIDVNTSNENGLTALHCAARKGKKDAFEYLLKCGALIDNLDNYKRTPLDYL